MTTADQYVLSCYQEIATLDNEHNISLVQHITDGRIYVKKTLTLYNTEVYRYLQRHYIRGLPEVVEIVEQEGLLIVIEEYISGQTLQAILDNGNRFSEQEAVEIIKDLCHILSELHSCVPPIVHRDIKPSNVIRTPDGCTRLLDMNAAKQVRPGQSEDTALIGTEGYAAPEQYGFSASTPQTDIYSLGVLLCELVTGSLPKENLPDGKLGKIVQKCTRIDPKFRYKSTRDLLGSLEALYSPGSLSVSENQKAGINAYTFPGFRSRSTPNMVTAIIGYLLLFYFCLTFTDKEIRSVYMIFAERILFLMTGLWIIFFTCNYRNIWDRSGLFRLFQISRIRNAWLRSALVLFLDVVMTILAIFIIAIMISVQEGFQ